MIPGQQIAGKQHPRTRIGYRPDEVAQLDRLLQNADTWIEAALCRLDATAPWEDTLAWREVSALTTMGRLDLLFELPGQSDQDDAVQAAEALFATALLPRARLFVEPFIDLDRTMDVGQGLLDPLCNPRPVFGVLRCLNALLQRFRVPFAEATSMEGDEATVRLLQGPTRTLVLLLPVVAGATISSIVPVTGLARLYRLTDGTVEEIEADQLPEIALDQPSLVIVEN